MFAVFLTIGGRNIRLIRETDNKTTITREGEGDYDFLTIWPTSGCHGHGQKIFTMAKISKKHICILILYR